jgi:hypothetical protein
MRSYAALNCMRDRSDPSLESKTCATPRNCSGRIKRSSYALSNAHSFLLFRHDVGNLPALWYQLCAAMQWYKEASDAHFERTTVLTHGSRSSIPHLLNYLSGDERAQSTGCASCTRRAFSARSRARPHHHDVDSHFPLLLYCRPSLCVPCAEKANGLG